MGNTPNIRFKGFTNDWEQRKLGDICSRVQGNDGRMELPTLTISAANGWMKQEDRFSGNIAGKEQTNYTLLHKGELSYNHGNSKLAKYGTVFSLQTYEEALVPRVYHSFKVENESADFIEYYFATKIPDRELRKLISSGARMDGLLNIGYDDFMGIKMMFPSASEQDKIAEYFRALDHIITLHQRKCDETKKLKKFMLQKMFPKKDAKKPEIRFAGFTDDWEQRKLGDICSRVQGNDGRMELPTLTISAANGWMKQEDRFSGNIAGKEQTNYTLLHKGELSYNHGNSKLAKYGTVFSLQTYEEALVPRVYHSFKVENESADFIEYYFATKIPDRELRKLISSGARMDGLLNIGYDDFMGIKMMFPSASEQDKIAEYFRALDHIITLHQRKCDETKKLKKFMLQKMFPKKDAKKPEIRFAGFTDDWEQRKFGSLLEETRNKTTVEDEDTLLSCAIDGMYLNSELFSHFRGSSNIGYLKVKKNDLILSAQNLHLGNCNVNLRFEHGIISPAYKVYELVGCNPLFMQAWVKKDSTKDFFLKASTEGASVCRKNIVWEELYKQELPVPSIEEQTKVGEYFNSLDHLITLHQRKCDELKEFKKYMLQNMFPQKG